MKIKLVTIQITYFCGVIQSEITTAKPERNGSADNYRLPARNGTFSFTTEKRSFDLKVNLLKRLCHRLSVKAKIKCQSANLSYQNDSHIAKHAVNFIPNWWNCVI